MKNSKTLIIAEAGVNHNGSLERALQLVDIAAAAGADIVKFQTFKSENLTTKTAKMADYQKKNIGQEESQFEMLKKLELSFEDHFAVIEHCKTRNIRFLSTAFDLESLEFLRGLKMGLWKIPSGEITNLPYLKIIAQQNDPVILSTGMADILEVEAAVNALCEAGLTKNKLSVLHCNTEYPTPMSDVNLRAMVQMGKDLGVQVGYSDHTMGIEVSIAAVALGASVIEKHFTLNRELPGPDHKASLEPVELKAMVEAIRNIEVALGVSEKKATQSELKNRGIVRKSIVAKTDIQPGDLLTSGNMTCSRPGTGMSPMLWNQVLNSKAQKAYSAGDLIDEKI